MSAILTAWIAVSILFVLKELVLLHRGGAPTAD
jgi:hypothetical protein